MAKGAVAYDWKDSAGSRKKPAKVLDHLRVKEAENGGHSVEHHFTSFEHEPETHVFGADQGPEMLAHVAKAANIKSPDKVKGEQSNEHEERGGEEEA
jgi:hypothetical protein